MTNAPDCPAWERLRLLLLGLVADEEAVGLEAHLLACADCVRAAATLAAEDTFVGTVRAGARAAIAPDAWAERVIALLREAGARPGRSQAETPTTETAHDSGPGPADPLLAPSELGALLGPSRAPGELGRLGPYRALAVLGAGGMGVVFRAEDTRLGRLVALKVMRPALAVSAAGRQRFLREARASAAVKHDHIVTVYDTGEERGCPYIAMELLEGEPLDARLRRAGALPVTEVVRLGRQVAEGLAAAHARGLVHRDVKPGNVWLEARGSGPERVRLVDFGLARGAEGEEELTRLGALVGTPAYMSPEQAAGDPVDARSDLFSLGCVLYEMATGKRAFPGPVGAGVVVQGRGRPQPPGRLNAAVPGELAGLIMKLLAPDPAARPSAEAVVGSLRSMEQRAARPPEAATGVGPASPRRWRGTAVAAGFLALAVVAGGAVTVVVVYRLAGQGELVIEADAEREVRVTLRGQDKGVEVFDATTGRSFRVRPGTYEAEVQELPDGVRVLTKSFTLTRGGREVLKISLRPPAPGGLTPAAPGRGSPLSTWS